MDEFMPNERLRRARSLKGWSQAELAAELGTSFEIVSRWERGVTLPSPYYRERLCALFGQTADELGLKGEPGESIVSPTDPLVFIVSARADAARPIVSSLRTALQERGIALLSSSQLGRRSRENARATLQAAMQAAFALVVIISPEARASSRVREAFELAKLHQLPVYGIWIAGEHWQACLPEGITEVLGPVDMRTGETLRLVREIAAALVQENRPSVATDIVPVDSPPPAPAPVPFSVGGLLRAGNWHGPPRVRARVYHSLLAVVILGIVLASSGTASRGASFFPVRGGTWIEAIHGDPLSLIPNGAPGGELIDQALYLPLFYGDPDGLIHPGAASEVPTLPNGGISADGHTWTFHLRPHLVWSDGQPYDARDVDFSWRLWLDPAFGATNPDGVGLSFIKSATVSADHLSITFHLKQAYAPFLQYWVDGDLAPLPAHHFRSIAPAEIQRSGDNLDPVVTSGPFLMAESMPGDHYMVVRNPRYYLAGAGLPYLDTVIFRVADEATTIAALEAGAITSTSGLDLSSLSTYERLAQYQLVTAPESARFEALFFDLRNVILARHPEVRRAMALAINRRALVTVARHGFASPLCTDHPSGIHPGYVPANPEECPEFDLAAANKLLDDSGWVKGPDGVRAQGAQRLEFEYSTVANNSWRDTSQSIVQHDFLAIGIKLDIQNYSVDDFFGSFLPTAQPSPPTEAMAGAYDIAEYGNQYGYDPDESFLLACDQIPPNGPNFSYYCNPTLDALFRQELTTVEPGMRQKLFMFIHDIYLEDLPFIVLYSTTDLAIAAKGTHNYVPSPIEGSTANIAEWWCDRGNCGHAGSSD